MATLMNELTEGEKLAMRIREVRRIAGRTQVEFASEIGVSRSFLSEVEARKSKPSIEMILGTASRFPEIASPHWFLLGYGQPGPYSEPIKTPGLDVNCVLYCMRLVENVRNAKRIKADNLPTLARALTVVLNTYLSSYQAVVLARGKEDHEARQEGEGRSAEIAASMISDLDDVTYDGLTLPRPYPQDHPQSCD